ncbi:hypothetical protein [Nostoc sp.]|uniref:hypothetical protein n=1 Tax=Nostoc sp. TaxID=1180 RepID=UPI002FF854BF
MKKGTKFQATVSGTKDKEDFIVTKVGVRYIYAESAAYDSDGLWYFPKISPLDDIQIKRVK